MAHSKHINILIILTGVAIDFLGTTIAQVFMLKFISDQMLLIVAGGVFSVLAGYFVARKSGETLRRNIFTLCVLNIFLGIYVLWNNGVLGLENLELLSLTPILNLLGGYLARKKL
jgi:hypothetical protein